MIRDEQIITEAKKYYSDSINCHNAFLHGVEWADKYPVNVWHEAKEKPRAKEWILVQFEEDEYETLALSESGVNTWFNVWVDEYRAIRWAYIADLLPKGGEKNKYGNKTKIMNVKEAIELINNSDNCYSLFDAKDLLKGCKFKRRQDHESNSWYIMATDIYEVEDGYIGVSGVSELKSEIMDYSDTGEHCFAEEYQVIQTITYLPKFK